jgi:hypothetical protein
MQRLINWWNGHPKPEHQHKPVVTYFSYLSKDLLIYVAQFYRPDQFAQLAEIPEYSLIRNEPDGYLFQFYWIRYLGGTPESYNKYRDVHACLSISEAIETIYFDLEGTDISDACKYCVNNRLYLLLEVYLNRMQNIQLALIYRKEQYKRCYLWNELAAKDQNDANSIGYQKIRYLCVMMNLHTFDDESSLKAMVADYYQSISNKGPLGVQGISYSEAQRREQFHHRCPTEIIWLDNY